MNLLVVDDEPVILNGIINPLNWTDTELEQIFSASDADEAMEVIGKENVDIVITDITMPGRSGLDLCDEISKLYPDIYLIILSGYDYFEYAQKAMSIGVKEYLLKPATIERIVQAVNTAIHKQNDNRRQQRRVDELENIFEDSIDHLRGRWIMSLIQKKSTAEEIQHYMELYDIKLPKDGNTLAVIGAGDLSGSEIWQENDDFLVQFALLNIITEILHEHGASNIITYDRQNNLLVLCCVNEDGNAAELFDKIRNIVNEMLDLNLNIGICPECSFSELKEAYSEAVSDMHDDAGRNKENQKESSARDVISTAKRYITEHLDEDISLQNIASVVFMNPNYFSNLFKKKTGTIFTEYVSQVKLEKAKELLKNDEIMIWDIAQRLGFKDQRYFSSFFKKRMGMTPTQYREKIKEL